MGRGADPAEAQSRGVDLRDGVRCRQEDERVLGQVPGRGDRAVGVAGAVDRVVDDRRDTGLLRDELHGRSGTPTLDEVVHVRLGDTRAGREASEQTELARLVERGQRLARADDAVDRDPVGVEHGLPDAQEVVDRVVRVARVGAGLRLLVSLVGGSAPGDGEAHAAVVVGVLGVHQRLGEDLLEPVVEPLHTLPGVASDLGRQVVHVLRHRGGQARPRGVHRLGDGLGVAVVHHVGGRVGVLVRPVHDGRTTLATGPEVMLDELGLGVLRASRRQARGDVRLDVVEHEVVRGDVHHRDQPGPEVVLRRRELADEAQARLLADDAVVVHGVAEVLGAARRTSERGCPGGSERGSHAAHFQVMLRSVRSSITEMTSAVTGTRAPLASRIVTQAATTEAV